jgi:hypothetical protein
MGKTYKDKNKWEKKRDREGKDAATEPRKSKRPRYEEVLPEGDQLDPYELYDFDDYE